ncbi:zinc finger protein 382-like [Branchiostoma floridae]|uniref:Zinc finger protein 382-like n=1 Tax=Branchiostoma floridae TaxID=7739 RepID=A0A9J7HL51_BRAFL|nr:zinc finger protein 382-like [Branchiostoma floridae]
MEGLTCEPLHAEQTANETHIKEEKTEDTKWQQDGQEDELLQETYDVNLPHGYPGNNTGNTGEQKADTRRQQGVLIKEICGVNCTTPEEGVSPHLHVQEKDVSNAETFGVNCTGSEEEILPQTAVQSHTTQEVSHVAKHTYICWKCGYRAEQRDLIFKHMREQHTEGKAFKCDQCDYSAAQKSQVDQHAMLKHSGEKPYKCGKCGFRTAIKKGQLDIHVMTRHTGEKPYMCGECGYRTAHMSVLSQHKRIHTGEKPYLCEECGYTTNKSWNLTLHKRKHAGEKPANVTFDWRKHRLNQRSTTYKKTADDKACKQIDESV